MISVHLRHPEPAVRLSAALAAADVPPGESPLGIEVSVELEKLATGDNNFRDALLAAAAPRAGFVLLGAVSSDRQPTADGLAALQTIARQYASSGGDRSLSFILYVAARKPARPEIMAALINGLSTGWPAGKRPDDDGKLAEAVGKLLPTVPQESRPRLLKLASAWGVKGLDAQLAEITKGLLATFADAKAADADRLATAKQVVELLPDDADTAGKLLAAVSRESSPQFAAGVFEALAQSKAKDLGPAVIAKLPELPPTARPAALRLVLARPEPTKAFLDAVEAGKLRFDLLDLDQKTALASHPDKTIAERAKKLLAQGGGLPDPDRQKVIEGLAAVLKQEGNAAEGKKLFTQHCGKCHKHGGEGQQIGPDLTGFAVHPKEEILIAVLDPSRSVEGNYRTYTATLLDGRVITGLLAAETRTTVELLDAENKRHALNRDDLESFKESQKSLMPEGFEKQMSADELTHLMAYLTQKGKYVPIPLDKAATIVTTKGMFFTEEDTVGRLVFRDWGPKEFEGVPFVLVDPQTDRVKNAVMLNGPNGQIPPKMPKSVTLPCNAPAKAIHLLSGISGWGYPASEKGTVSMTVRLHYADGQAEDHGLKNGEHFADYIRRVDVPGSRFAFALRTQQLRYLAVTPKRAEVIKQIEFAKGADPTAPIVMAVTVETP